MPEPDRSPEELAIERALYELNRALKENGSRKGLQIWLDDKELEKTMLHPMTMLDAFKAPPGLDGADDDRNFEPTPLLDARETIASWDRGDTQYRHQTDIETMRKLADDYEMLAAGLADEREKVANAIDYLKERSWSNGVIPKALDILGYPPAAPDKRPSWDEVRTVQSSYDGQSWFAGIDPNAVYTRAVLPDGKVVWQAESLGVKIHGDQPPLIECPHWAPGTITLRRGCTACAAEAEARNGR